jgi:hypothetical protein
MNWKLEDVTDEDMVVGIMGCEKRTKPEDHANRAYIAWGEQACIRPFPALLVTTFQERVDWGLGSGQSGGGSKRPVLEWVGV